MSKRGRILLALFVLVFGGFYIAACSGALESGTRTYNGKGVFDTIEEALVFQQDVVMEAKRVGAEINKADITMTSPPTFMFSIKMPATEYDILFGDQSEKFKYGEAWVEYPNWGLASLLIVMLLTLFAFIYGILSGWLERNVE